MIYLLLKTLMLYLLLFLISGCKPEGSPPSPITTLFSTPSQPSPLERPTEISHLTTVVIHTRVFTQTPLPATPTTQPSTTSIPANYVHILPGPGIALVFVPEGEFFMGSTDEDRGADQDEKPQHPVWLNSYWIGQIEVTNDMFTRLKKGLAGLMEMIQTL